MILAFILGLCFGSFIFAFYERFTHEKRLFTARSFCFSCEKNLKFYHLFPLFSFIFLRGKCAYCGAKISPLSPLCELLCGFLFVFAFKFSANALEFAFLSLYLSSLLLLSLIDIKLKAVPEILLWANFIFALCFALDMRELYGFFFWGEFSGGFVLYSLCFMGGVFLLKSLISCLLNLKKQREKLESMGEADILLIGAMGGILGFTEGFLLLFVASFFGLLYLFGILFWHKFKLKNSLNLADKGKINDKKDLNSQRENALKFKNHSQQKSSKNALNSQDKFTQKQSQKNTNLSYNALPFIPFLSLAFLIVFSIRGLW